MNYYQARQVSDGPLQGKWHYTQMRDGNIWPVGYCGAVRHCPDCKGASFMSTKVDCETCNNEGAVVIPEEERCPGHDTAEEAMAHQREYELDHAKFVEGQPVDDALIRHNCEAVTDCGRCGKLTTSYAKVGPGMKQDVFLCDEHLDKEGLGSAWAGPHAVVSS